MFLIDHNCASVRSVTDHINTCAKKGNCESNQATISKPKIGPVRLAAKRQRELMCLIKYMENHEYEWHNVDDVDTTGLVQPKENTVEDGTLIISVVDMEATSLYTNTFGGLGDTRSVLPAQNNNIDLCFHMQKLTKGNIY